MRAYALLLPLSGSLWAADSSPEFSKTSEEDPIVISADERPREHTTTDHHFSTHADQNARWTELKFRDQGIERIDDLSNYDPRLVMTQDRGRNSDIRLRGLGGNRVQIRLDDLPIADGAAGRDYVDLNMLEALEVQFGPGSSRFGSDALAGSLRMQSLRADRLDHSDRPLYAYGKFHASSLDSSTAIHARLGQSTQKLSWLAAYTLRQGSEEKAVGEAPEYPQEKEMNAALFSSTYKWNGLHKTSITYDLFNEKIDTTLQDFNLFQEFGNDERQRERFSLEHSVGDPTNNTTFYKFQVSTQETWSDEQTTLNDFGTINTGFNRNRVSKNEFKQDLLAARFDSIFTINHRQQISTGLDITDTNTEDYQSQFTTLQTPPTSSASDPTRSFPISHAQTGGVYLEWFDPKLNTKTQYDLGLRYDFYKLDLTVDEAYENNLAGVNAPTDLSDGAFTSRGGISYALHPQHSVHAKVATGYRNGRYDEANEAFTNFTNGYTISPNPDLKPERSLGIDIGYKGSGSLQSEFTFHATWYDDFIDQQFVGIIPNNTGVGPHSTLAQYKSINRDEVFIYGLDYASTYFIGSGFFISAAISYIEGEDKNTKTGIDSLEPLRGTASVGWRDNSLKWHVEAFVRAAAEKKDVERIDAFIPESYAVGDIRVHYLPNQNLHCSVAWINIFDQHYWKWSDVEGVSNGDNNARKDYFASAPSHFTFTISYLW